MGTLVRATMLFSLSVAPGFAATVLFQGAFAADDQVALFNITANISETITIQTDSYAGGTVNSTIIPAGGFAPAACLFDNNCYDFYFLDTLGPGTFSPALAVFDDTPVNTAVTDGFADDGDPGFTCLQEGTSSSFCDLTTALGTTPTGTYASAITGAFQFKIGLTRE